MTYEQQIEQKVIELAAAEGGVSPDQVTREHHFVNDLNFDSLAQVEFVMELEDEFGIQITDDAAQGIRTVGQAIDAVLERLKQEQTG